MRNLDTEAIKLKSLYLKKISEKAAQLAICVDEIYDAKHWLDMCEEDLSYTLSQDTNETPCRDEVDEAKRVHKKAKDGLASVLRDYSILECQLRHFKEDVECLGTEVFKYTEDKNK